MTKTIEEAVQSIAKDFIMEHKSRINNDAPLTHECAQYTIERIFAMPLSERLTSEEKEQIRFAHKTAKTFAECANPMSAEVFKGQYLLLESIFGSELFERKEEQL